METPLAPRGYRDTFLRVGLVSMAGIVVCGAIFYLVTNGTNKL